MWSSEPTPSHRLTGCDWASQQVQKEELRLGLSHNTGLTVSSVLQTETFCTDSTLLVFVLRVCRTAAGVVVQPASLRTESVSPAGEGELGGKEDTGHVE